MKTKKKSGKNLRKSGENLGFVWDKKVGKALALESLPESNPPETTVD